MDERLGSARLYFVVEASASDDLLDSALAGGVDVLQLRDKDAGDDELLAAAERFRAACDAHDALFVLNDRPELALACDADGIHVGQDDLPVGGVRRLVGGDLLIGLSTHSVGQLEEGLASEADYLSVGPVWETPTKAGRPAAGLDYVRHAARVATKPWFAIGGIDVSTVGEVAAAGASRVVVVRAIRDAADPRAAAAELRSALEASHVA
jgi:thiamine-phosphate pyrophosphorylase